MEFLSRIWPGALCLVLGVGIGWFSTRFLQMPEIFDEAFWKTFLSGSPAAGLMAIIGAMIAFSAARHSSKSNRVTAASDSWWKQAEWALGCTTSEDEVTRSQGLIVLNRLKQDTTYGNPGMVAELLEIVYPPASATDGDPDDESGGAVTENGGRVLLGKARWTLPEWCRRMGKRRGGE